MKRHIGIFLACILLISISACISEHVSPILNRTYTVAAGFADDATRVSLETSSSLDMIAKWQQDDQVKVLIYGSKNYMELPAVSVRDVSQDGKGCFFSYAIPEDYDVSESGYRLVCYTIPPGSDDLEKPKEQKETATIDLPLVRYPLDQFRAPVLFDGEVIENNTAIAFHHLYTYELLHVTNLTDQPISFSLSGFNATTWWFRTYTTMDILQRTYTAGGGVAGGGQPQSSRQGTKQGVQPVTESPLTTIAPKSEAIIVSAYIPNGNKISDAQMVAVIDEETVVSSNTLSSSVELETGRAYHMYAEWDGTELKFKKEEEIPWDVMTVSAAINPKTLYGSFVGSVTGHSLEGLRTGFRVWKDNAEDYVEYDATLDGESAFSLSLTFDDYVEIANGASVKGTYKVSAYVIDEKGNRHHGNILEFTIEKDQPEMPTEPTEGELIDMGLSVKWASCNVGANEPQEVGGFYAWGEIEKKSNYDWSNYELCSGSENTLTKYCTQSSFGFVDNKTILDFSDDVAYVTSQGKTRMPTAAEWQELKDKCVWTQKKYEGQDGYLVASPITGNAIFIPCNGFKTGTNYYNFYAPYYWSSELSSDSSQNAVNFDYINRWALNDQYRFEGLGVRPVSDSKDAVIDVNPSTLDFGAVTVGSSVTKTVTITNTGDGPLTFHLAGGGDRFNFAPADEVTLEKGQSCEVSITFRPQSISQTGTVIRVFSNASNGTQYIRCNGEGAEGTVAVPEIVDLGLPSGIKWASLNLGADSDMGMGDFYAWGETATKSDYSWANYVFGFEPTSDNMAKYNITDGLTILRPENDVAHKLLSGNWRMPTYEEWNELRQKCDWVEIKNGEAIIGYHVTSKVNGASINLPAVGYMDGREVKDTNTARYWLSSITGGNDLTKARNSFESCYYHDWSGLAYYGDDRCLGMQIRPVYDNLSDLNLQVDGFVDLGLSVDWASKNMGAESLDGLGDRYAWGDIKPGQGFSWSSYRFGASDELTKYNELDGKKVLDRDDDIVYLAYGGQHRIPTMIEWDELWNNCLIKVIVINARRGYLMTSKINNKSIFLPFTGYMDEFQLHDGMQSRYWSSTITNGNNLSKARNLKEGCYYSDWSGLAYYGDDRCFGMPVRGIKAKNEVMLTEGERIDLGLSVQWASCNVGASRPEESGGFYSWGEISPKSDFSWDNYKFCMDQIGDRLVKYNAEDGRLYLEGGDDIVHKMRGGNWRMPTYEEWKELKDNCQWNEATLNGVRGYHIISKINGNSVFLPRTGYMDGAQFKDTEAPRYWSSSMTNGTNLRKARNLNESCYYSDWSGLSFYGDDRYLGMPIRGVFDDSAEKALTDGEAIDMGVSVRWARSNVGAKEPEEAGYYFGWGEVTTRIDYSWASYKFSNNGASTMTKYNDIDNNTVLDTSDDAAYTVTSGEFRMPTIDEWRELMNNTTQVIKIKNGQLGYILTSKINGNTIFLPFVGYVDGKEILDGMKPRYWSSSLTNGNNRSKARNLNESCYYSDWSGLSFYGDDRYLGMPVRGVKK